MFDQLRGNSTDQSGRSQSGSAGKRLMMGMTEFFKFAERNGGILSSEGAKPYEWLSYQMTDPASRLRRDKVDRGLSVNSNGNGHGVSGAKLNGRNGSSGGNLRVKADVRRPMGTNGNGKEHSGVISRKPSCASEEEEEEQGGYNFVKGLMHDLTNMITLLYLDVEDLKRLFKDNADYSRICQLSVWTRRASILAGLLSNPPDKSEGSCRITKVNGIIEYFIKLLKNNFPHIDFEFKPSDPDPLVLMSNIELQRILQNLLMNAVEAIERNGTIQISTSIEEASLEEEKGANQDKQVFVVLKIKDSGCGMNDVQVENLFKHAYSTKGTGKHAKHKGIGLINVYNIVNSLGGKIDIESRPGTGTEFKIYLPPAGILAVEDNLSLLDLTIANLKNAGFRVFPARDGYEALSYFERGERGITLVFSDMNLGDMDGSELFFEIRNYNREIPFIFTSGDSEKSDKRKNPALNCKGTRFIDRFTDNLEVVRFIRETISQHCCSGMFGKSDGP